jgi:hypothetical protein
MTPWEDRPFEVANLLNPAFCGLLLADAACAYAQRRNEGLPYPLSFLVLPLSLHRETRGLLPATIRTKMHVWLQVNAQVRIGFASRCRHLVPYTKEAIVFGTVNGLLRVSSSGCLETSPGRRSSTRTSERCDVMECQRSAAFVGRWLASSTDVASVYMMWGIMP